MYYCLSGEDYPHYDIAFSEDKINSKEEVGKEINDVFSYMINCLEESNVPYDCCGIIPYIGLFVNEKDLRRLDNCNTLKSRKQWSLTNIDILDQYVCVNFGFLYYIKDGKMDKILSKDLLPKYYIIKYSDLIKSFNLFRYKLVNTPKNFFELKFNFINNRTVIKYDYMTADPCIVYYNENKKYDTVIYDFKELVKSNGK